MGAWSSTPTFYVDDSWDIRKYVNQALHADGTLFVYTSIVERAHKKYIAMSFCDDLNGSKTKRLILDAEDMGVAQHKTGKKGSAKRFFVATISIQSFNTLNASLGLKPQKVYNPIIEFIEQGCPNLPDELIPVLLQNSKLTCLQETWRYHDNVLDIMINLNSLMDRDKLRAKYPERDKQEMQMFERMDGNAKYDTVLVYQVFRENQTTRDYDNRASNLFFHINLPRCLVVPKEQFSNMKEKDKKVISVVIVYQPKLGSMKVEKKDDRDIPIIFRVTHDAAGKKLPDDAFMCDADWKLHSVSNARTWITTKIQERSGSDKNKRKK